MPPDRPVLTWMQHKLLTFLRTYIAECGYPPSMKEMAAGCGLSSVSSVSHQLGQLADKGYITRVAGTPRAIRVNPVPGGAEAR